MPNDGRPAHTEEYYTLLDPVLALVDEILDGWSGEGNYQIPTLLEIVQAKMGWDQKMLNAKDPVVRDYLRNHPKWFITKGAKGGVQRREVREQRQALKEAKERAKVEINAQLDAEVARRKALVEAAKNSG